MKIYYKKLYRALIFILMPFTCILTVSSEIDEAAARQQAIDAEELFRTTVLPELQQQQAALQQQQAANAKRQLRNQFSTTVLPELQQLKPARTGILKPTSKGVWPDSLLTTGSGVPNLPNYITDEIMETAFNNAKAIADGLTRDNIDTNLRSIGPWNDDLVWDRSKTRILVTSWMPLSIMRDIYLTNLKGSANTTTRRGTYMWVTPAPVAQRFAASYDPSQNNNLPLHYRLNQLFGLPHDKRAKHFVELWVKPEDLRRSCANSETAGSSCIYDENRFNPKGKQKDYPAYNNIYKLLPETPDHKEWYKQQLQGLKGNNFPWTGLGYTLDWGNKAGDYLINNNPNFPNIANERNRNAGTIRGETEFMIRQGAPVYIERIISTNDYGNAPRIKQDTIPPYLLH